MLTSLTPPKLRAAILKGMEKRVSEFNSGETVFELYAPFMFWSAIIGGSILTIIGATMDGLILYGIGMSATQRLWFAAPAAVILAFLIQIFIRGTIVLTVISMITGKYKSKGYRSMTGLIGVLFFISLSASLYLSFQTRAVVEVMKPAPTLLRVDTAAHDRQVADAAALYDAQIATLHQSQITTSAEYDRRIRSAATTADASWLRQLKIKALTTSTDKIARLNAQKTSALALLDSRYFAAQDSVSHQNAILTQKHQSDVRHYGSVVMYANVGINIILAFLLLIYTKFALTVKGEQSKTASNTAPGAPIPVGNTMGYRDAIKTVETPVIQGAQADDATGEKQFETIRIVDIKTLKDYSRTYYGRSIYSKKKKTRDDNKRTFEGLVKKLEDVGIKTVITSDGLEFK